MISSSDVRLMTATSLIKPKEKLAAPEELGLDEQNNKPVWLPKVLAFDFVVLLLVQWL